MRTFDSGARGARRLAGLAVVLACAAAPAAWAAKPEWAGNGHGKEDKAQRQTPGGQERDGGRPPGVAAPDGAVLSVQIGGYFGDRQREAVRVVFGRQIGQGGCPPGLAKKHNGCRPPGQAKAWALGQPLPGGVVTYPIPRDLQRRLGEPPPGYKFVRVAADILLIAIGTAIVIDAIEDLGGL